MKLHFIVYTLLFIFLASCKDKPIDPIPEDKTGNEITFTLDHNVNGSDLIFNDQTYMLDAGTEITINRLAYILSNFYLVKSSMDTLALEGQYALIDVNRDEFSFTLKNIPEGSYSALGFSLGLDSITNHSDPTQYPVDHPLSNVNNGLHWDWTSGYIFIALEGKSITSGNSYVYHVAGDRNRVDFQLPIQFTKAKNNMVAKLHMNYDEIFKNPHTFNMDTEGLTIHSEDDPVTLALVKNMEDMFSILSIQ